ncbi:hypothetical protein HU742_023885 [Pseudomonas sp. SWRI102]|uniref:Uncharacterized protein n=1 Tax=Pseudomonas marvdashtae TaxID=2745500 RepID=A0A923FTB4_9PSED|nr:hypothetical protein [Pseudomonas marvdashtae]MBV4554190.1 hypothetical protein [Pseudomonas marvdashtae]
MTMARQVLFTGLGMLAALQCMAADIHFSSASDFTSMILTLKQENDPNPGYVLLDVMLSPDAQKRVARMSRESLDQPVRIFINGTFISRPTVKSALDMTGTRLSIPREIAPSLIPTLLEPSAP